MKKTLMMLVALLFPLSLFAQEHPEHPEHPKKAEAKKELNTGDLEKAIKADIAEKTKKTGGVLKVKDKELKKTWNLKLDKVHTERLSKLSADTYFACVDMKDETGKVIDVDFFMKAKGDKLVMHDLTVHKVEGKPRYNWEEKGGYWKRVPVKS